jgi:hypothetical protein
MPISQFKNPGDTVTSGEYNALVQFANSLETRINTLNTSLTNTQGLNNRLLATDGGGLSVTVAGGTLRRVSDGTLLVIAPFSISIPSGVSNRWIWIKPDGTSVLSAKRPREGYIIAQVSTSVTAVTSLIDRRSFSFEITQLPERKIVHAVKLNALSIGVGAIETLRGFTLESLDGVNGYGITATPILDLATGNMAITQTAEYSMFVRAQVLGGSNLGSGKLMLYSGSTELRILEEKEVAQNRITLSGYFEGTLDAGTTVTSRVQINSGTGLSIPANSNTEIIMKVYG